MEWTAEQINEHIKKFHLIKDNPIPPNTKVTIWCESDSFSESGFADNVTIEEMGLELLIAESWILQSDLDKLCEGK
jgi:hypothetical protein